MADTFTQDEHSVLARHLIERSAVHFDDGEPLEGAETLWGAAAHALIAVALSEGGRYDSHGALKRVALRLPDIPGQQNCRRPLQGAPFCAAPAGVYLRGSAGAGLTRPACC